MNSLKRASGRSSQSTSSAKQNEQSQKKTKNFFLEKVNLNNGGVKCPVLLLSAFQPKMTTFLYVFCEGCGKEVDSSSYPEKVSLCETCEVTGKLNTSTSEYLALSPQPSNNMASTLNITPEQIKTHRATRKAAGLAGCISGRPVPEMDLFGYKDVQSWRPADPMNPHCFCFDCRDLWDNDASIDLKLIQEGHKIAMWTYAELLPKEFHPV